MSDVVSVTDTASSRKNKKTGRVMGAAVGTLIAPGIGTVIGAAHGTGNAKTSEDSTGIAHIHNIVKEEVSDIELDVQYENGYTETLKHQCYEKQANILLALFEKKSTLDNHFDPYEEIKKLKELFDIGVTTQEESGAKKKQLLELQTKKTPPASTESVRYQRQLISSIKKRPTQSYLFLCLYFTTSQHKTQMEVLACNI